MAVTSKRDAYLAHNLALREYYRRDFPTYAREQLWIETKVAGKIENLDISKKPLQTMFWQRAHEQIKTVGYIDGDIIKGRQQGSSTCSQGTIFWRASLTRNYNTLLIAQDDPTTRAIFEKARFFYEHLQAWIKPAIRKSNRQELVFAVAEGKKHVTDHGLGSTMSFQAATNMLAGTGTTRQGLHLSECAKYRGEDIDTLVSSVYPVLYRGPGSIRLKESTAFIGGGWFKEVCEEARDGRTQEFLLFVPAYLEPDNRYPLNLKDPDDKDLARMVGLDAEERYIVRTAKRGHDSKDAHGKAYEIPPFEVPPEYIKFRRVTIAQPGWDEDLYHQEYPTTFNEAWISRDSRVFNHQKLYDMQKKHVQQPRELCTWDYQTRKFLSDQTVRMGPQENYIAIWEDPILGHDYDIGADVAAGIEGGDYSTAVVWERRSRRQVAEVHLHIDPSDYGTLLFFLGQWYFNAQIAVEWTGGYGISTDTQLKRLNYPNISFWKHRDQVVPMPTKKTGWETTQTSKAYLVSYFRHFLNHDTVVIRSLCLLNEMFHFIQIPYGNGYEYRAETGNDDLVMAAGIGLVVSDDENLHRLDEVAPEPKSIVIAPQHLVDTFDFTDRLPNSLVAEIRGGY